MSSQAKRISSVAGRARTLFALGVALALAFLFISPFFHTHQGLADQATSCPYCQLVTGGKAVTAKPPRAQLSIDTVRLVPITNERPTTTILAPSIRVRAPPPTA